MNIFDIQRVPTYTLANYENYQESYFINFIIINLKKN